jgi:hypothetical protein
MTWTFYTPDISPSIGTALPSNPLDGQVFVYTDSLSAPTYQWQLRYVAAASKWIFIGGSPLYALTAGANSTSSTTYVDLGGPTVTLPLAGHYWVSLSTRMIEGSGTGGRTGHMSSTLGAGSANDDRALSLGLGASANAYATLTFSTVDHSGELSATNTISARYRNAGAASITYQQRRIDVIPIYVK